ncbi:adenylate cyclase domain protein [Mycobacterium xenopi 4042]|uniref:Adenylate cyclase domain protein n=1 Tax=Mycobacterium xenopi 4042 TaxID=1299334 RepID=X8DBI9_MYCXE|nr:adenylate cyclase domain protein [Mycobacterium xenopi 3993]EUA65724.1 adenylate cyclase domain protein [Mycobacterium xenopi 4042]
MPAGPDCRTEVRAPLAARDGDDEVPRSWSTWCARSCATARWLRSRGSPPSARCA